MSKSNLERVFETRWRQLASDAPEPEREYLFALEPLGRRWRFDFAWPERKIAVEIDGGQWQAHGGRHARDSDREKHNAAQVLGWRVLHYSGAMLKRDPVGVVGQVREALEVSDGLR